MNSEQILFEEDSEALTAERDRRLANNTQVLNLEINQSSSYDQNQRMISNNNTNNNKAQSNLSQLQFGLSDVDQLQNNIQGLDSRRQISIEQLNSTNVQSSTKRRLNYNSYNQNNCDDSSLYYLNEGKGFPSLKQQDKSQLFTKLNEITINTDGADRRRMLLNNLDQDLEDLHNKNQQSVVESSLLFEEVKKTPSAVPLPMHQLYPIEQSLESLYKHFNGDRQTKREQSKDKSTAKQEGGGSQYLQGSIPQNVKKVSSGGGTADYYLKSAKSSPEERFQQLKFPSTDMLKTINVGSGQLPMSNFRISQMLKGDYDDQMVSSSRRVIQHEEHDHIITRPVTLIYIRRFINQLKKAIFSSLYKNITTHQIRLINDFAHCQEGKVVETNAADLKNKTIQTNQKVKDRLSKMHGAGYIYESYLKHIIISSQSNFFMLFQIILLFSIFIQMYNIPLSVCFDLHQDTSDILTVINLPIFFIEILLNCITSYYQDGLEVKKQKKIIKRYIKGSFFLDLITFCSLIVAIQSNNNWISLIFLCKLNQITKLINSIDDHYQLEHRFPSSFELLKLMLLIATIGHYCSCGFNYLGQYEVRNNNYSWLIYKKIDQKSWEVQYLNGLYFSFITMITVGYGDITPQTNIEIIYVLFMTFLSCGVFGYSINTIGSIFREMQIRKSELKRQKYEVSHYMRNRNIPKFLQIKVLKELEHFQHRQQQDGQKGDVVLQQLSLNIRNQLKKEYFGKILLKYKLLTLNFSEQFIEQLSLKLKEVFLSPDEVVLQQGEHLNKVFCLVNGELIAYQEKSNNKSDHIFIGKIKKGEFTDQRALFFEYNIQYGLKSAGISQLVYFTNEDFISTLRLFPQEYEKYCMLKDNMIFQEKFIDLKCYCCGLYGHQTDKCPMVHHIVDSSAIIFKQNKQDIIYKRIPYKRSNSRSINSIKHRIKICQDVKHTRVKIVQQFFPYYQPIILQNSEDEQFFNRVPEIFMESGELFVNLDDIVDEEEEFYSQLPSEIDQRNYLQIDTLSPVTNTYSQYKQPSQGGGINQNSQKQDSMSQIPNIFQQGIVFQGPILPIIGEKDKPLSILDTLETNNTPQQVLKNKQYPNSDKIEPNQKSPSSLNIIQLEQYQQQLSSISFTNTVNQILNPQYSLNPQNSLNHITTLQAPSSNLNNINSNAQGQQSTQSLHSKILHTQLFYGDEQNNNNSNLGQTNKITLPQVQTQDASSTYGSQRQRKGSLSNNNTSSVFNNIFGENNIITNNNNNNTNKSSKNDLTFKSHKPGNLFLQGSSLGQSYINSLQQSPTKLNGNNPLHLNTTHTAAFYDSPSHRPNNIQFSQANDFHIQPMSAGRMGLQQQLGYYSQQSGGSQGECLSPVRLRDQLKKTKSMRNIPFEQQRSQFQNNQLNLYSINQNSQLQPMHLQSQQYQIHSQFNSQMSPPYYNTTLHNETYLKLNPFEQLVCEFPYSSLDSLKIYKYYFTHGNIENVCKSHVKYSLNLIETRRYFKGQFKRKLVKQCQQNLSEINTEQNRKLSRQGALDIRGNFKKNSVFYKKRMQSLLTKKIHNASDISDASKANSQFDK